MPLAKVSGWPCLEVDLGSEPSLTETRGSGCSGQHLLPTPHVYTQAGALALIPVRGERWHTELQLRSGSTQVGLHTGVLLDQGGT